MNKKDTAQQNVGDMSENVLSEKELNDYIQKLTTRYAKAFEEFDKRYNAIDKEAMLFPIKMSKTDDIEELMLKAAKLKHESLNVMKNSMIMFASIKYDSKFIESKMKLELADIFLIDKFDRITDSLRDSFVASNKYLLQLKKLEMKYEVLGNSAEQMNRDLANDEINFRRLLEARNKLNGLL